MKNPFFAYEDDNGGAQHFDTLEKAQSFVDDSIRDHDDMYPCADEHQWKRAFIFNVETGQMWRPRWHERDNRKNHECPHGFGICQEKGYCPNPDYQYDDDDNQIQCPNENPWEHGDWVSEGKLVWDEYEAVKK